MQALYDCLQNVIGLSDTSCTCWDVDKPANFSELNASSSGKYIGEIDTIPVEIVNTFTTCEGGNVWNVLQKCRTKGIEDFVSAFTMLLKDRLEEKRNSFSGYIGTNIKNNFISTSGDIQGHYYELDYYKGGTMVIEKVELALQNITPPVSVDVNVYSSLDLSTSLGSATATLTAANTFTEATFSTPIEIDLGAIRNDLNEKIYVVYTVPVGARVPNNEMEIGCGTCGYNNQRLARNEHLLWMCQAGGIGSDSVSNLATSYRSDTNGRGLRVYANFYCDWWSWICNLTTTPNIVPAGKYKVDLGIQLSEIIKAASIANVYDFMLRSPSVNRYSISSSDKNLYYWRGHWNKQAREMTMFLVNNMPGDVTDCLKCRDKGRVSMSKVY